MGLTKNDLLDKYGSKLTEQILANRYMSGVTCEIKHGQLLFYETDINKALEDIKRHGKYEVEMD